MTNQFTDRYKALPTSKLLDIIENSKDYQPLAIETAKLELVNRQDIEAAEHELKEKRFQTQQTSEIDERKRKGIQDQAFKVLEYADPFVEKTPNKSIVIICVLLLAMFLYKTATSFSFLLSSFNNIANADQSIYWFWLEYFYLPVLIYFLWKKTGTGWTMLFVWLIYQIIMDFTYLYMCYQLSDIGNPVSNFLPLPSVSTSLSILFFHGAFLYFICKPTIKRLFSKKVDDEPEPDPVVADV